MLGVWQLHRYAYKKTLLATYQRRLTELPHPLNEIAKTNDLSARSVKARGHYINSLTVLLQNRFYHDELGFEVLTAFKMLDDKKLVLVDRGWIKKPGNQSHPSILSVTSEQEIKGHIKCVDEYQFILGKNILEPNEKPLIAQRVDINELSQITHQSFYPFILRLNADEANGYVRDWTLVTIPPARHMAYAVQWFALALVLLIAYFCFCCEEKKNTHAKNV